MSQSTIRPAFAPTPDAIARAVARFNRAVATRDERLAECEAFSRANPDATLAEITPYEGRLNDATGALGKAKDALAELILGSLDDDVPHAAVWHEGHAYIATMRDSEANHHGEVLSGAPWITVVPAGRIAGLTAEAA